MIAGCRHPPTQPPPPPPSLTDRVLHSLLFLSFIFLLLFASLVSFMQAEYYREWHDDDYLCSCTLHMHMHAPNPHPFFLLFCKVIFNCDYCFVLCSFCYLLPFLLWNLHSFIVLLLAVALRQHTHDDIVNGYFGQSSVKHRKH